MKQKLFFIFVFSLFFILGGASVAAAAGHSVGSVVSRGGVIYMVENGVLRPFVSEGAFLSYGFTKASDVVAASDEDLVLRLGSFVQFRDGAVVCSTAAADKGTCYLMTGGKKAGFVSAAVFKRLGFDFSRVLFGDVSLVERLADIRDGESAHPTGVLINRAGTIFIVDDSGLLGVPSLDVLSSWGYDVRAAVVANDADKKLVEVRTLGLRATGQLNPRDVLVAVLPSAATPIGAPVVVDSCSNIAGVQSSVPSGYVLENGNCVIANAIATGSTASAGSGSESAQGSTSGSVVFSSLALLDYTAGVDDLHVVLHGLDPKAVITYSLDGVPIDETSRSLFDGTSRLDYSGLNQNIGHYFSVTIALDAHSATQRVDFQTKQALSCTLTFVCTNSGLLPVTVNHVSFIFTTKNETALTITDAENKTIYHNDLPARTVVPINFGLALPVDPGQMRTIFSVGLSDYITFAPESVEIHYYYGGQNRTLLLN